ncbi:Two pore calcium channel protein 2 [Sparganum proliferum]
MAHSIDCKKAAVLIESAAAYRSVLHRLDSLRIKIYWIYYSRSFKIAVNICIFILVLLPFVEWPSSLTVSCDLRFPISRPRIPCGILESVEFLCLGVFLCRVLLLAYLFWKDEYLKNRWSLGEVVVLVISYVDLFVSIGFHCNEFYRVRRFLRPYFLLSSSQLLKKTIKCLWNTVPELASFLLLLLFWILNATLAGMCLFSGPLRVSSNITGLLFSRSGDNFRLLYENFYNLIVLLSTANHPDVMLQNYAKNRLSAIFLILFVAIGTFVFMKIFTAIMYNQFRGYLSSSVQKRLFRRRVAVRAAFEVLKTSSDPPVVPAHKIPEVLDGTSLPEWKKRSILERLRVHHDSQPLQLDDFMDLFKLLDLPSSSKKRPAYRLLVNPFATSIQRFFSSSVYLRISLLISLSNVILIAVQLTTLDERMKPNFAVLIVNLCFGTLYLLEQFAFIWAHGAAYYFTSLLSWFDCFIALFNMVLRFVELGLIFSHNGPSTGWSPYDLGQLANLLVILRALRFTQAFTRKPTIVTTLLQLPKHLSPVLGIFLSFYYIYALLGLNLFHGAIRYEEEPPTLNSTTGREMPRFECGTYQQLNYWSLNFDDFAASFFVLWSLMVTNNWHVIVRAFSDQLGRWVHLYMVSWWILAAVVLVTLTTAMIIESFLFAQEARDREMQAHASRLEGTAADPRCQQGRDRSSRWLRHCFCRCCPGQVNITDSEELLPTSFLEITHPMSEPPSSAAPNEADEPYYPTSFSFAEMFSAHLKEPTAEEIGQILQRHPEFSHL